MTPAAAPIGVVTGGGRLTISARCTNRWHRGTDCRRCVDACPVDAIVPRAGAPELDPSACLGCGACVPACPTEAITPRSPERGLELAAADLPAQVPVVLACRRRPAGALAGGVITHDRCLASLGPEELLELAGDPPRPVWVDDSPCATCEVGQLHVAIRYAVGRANALRDAFALRPLVHLVSGAPAPPAGEPADAETAPAGAGVSRRGLFRRMVAEITDRNSNAAGRRLPRRRQLLLRRLRAWLPPGAALVAGPVAADLGFGDVRVDADRCTACGSCARFCPTGALAAAIDGPAEGGTFTLAFEPAGCVDCGACTVACPEEAVTVVAAVDPAAVLAGRRSVLVTATVTACEVCGQATAVTGGRRCFGCRGGVVSSQRDEAGLMADLLGRLPPP